MRRTEDLVKALPSERQLRWFERNFYGFLHFGMNTFTGREWGDGSEDPALFNPSACDVRSWARTAKEIGMSALILTAKHHDGFCLWPTKTTGHSVKNSPYRDGQGDLVREVAEACREEGLAFGFYLSPWDRHADCYGTEAYNDYYCAQLEELLTGYGDIFMVWFDGACGEGPNGKLQIYDFPRYVELVRRLQPQAVMFSEQGPDVHWIGNEAGQARHAEWSVLPGEIATLHDELRNTERGKRWMEQKASVKKGCFPAEEERAFSFLRLNDAAQDLGSLEMMLESEQAVFCPSETDFSLRPGWFHHPEEEPHSLERLFDVWMKAVGGNSALHLNIPPTKEGLFDERDVKRLREFAAKRRAAFRDQMEEGRDYTRTTLHEGVSRKQQLIELRFAKKEKLGYLELAEDLHFGQRVSSFEVQKRNEDGTFFPIIQETTVGNRRLLPLYGTECEGLRIFVKHARDEVKLLPVKLYRA